MTDGWSYEWAAEAAAQHAQATEILNQRASDGWEFVDCCCCGAASGVMLFFKRRRYRPQEGTEQRGKTLMEILT